MTRMTETRNKYFMDTNYRTIDNVQSLQGRVGDIRENYFLFWYILNPQGSKPYFSTLSKDEIINLISQNITKDVNMKAIYSYIKERLSMELHEEDRKDLHEIKRLIDEIINRKRKITI